MPLNKFDFEKKEEQVNNELIELLTELKKRISDDSDVAWTRFNTVQELRDHIDDFISRLQHGDKDVLNEINIDFAPTSTFQELSISNGWSDDFMKLADQFDRIYKGIE